MIIFCVKGYNNLEEKIDEIISIKFKLNKDTKINKSKTLFNQTKSKKNIIRNSSNKIKTNKKNNLSAPIKKYKNNIINKCKNTKNNKITLNDKNLKRNNKKSLTINCNDNKENFNDFLKTTNDYELNNLLTL